MKTVYFAHSMEEYNTKKEKVALDFLKKHFKSVTCPNNNLSLGGDIKRYKKFIKENAYLVIFMALEGKYVGRGVYAELMQAGRNHIPVLRLEMVNGQPVLTSDTLVVECHQDDWVRFGEVIKDGTDF